MNIYYSLGEKAWTFTFHLVGNTVLLTNNWSCFWKILGIAHIPAFLTGLWLQVSDFLQSRHKD